jgi:hypothetical protein
MESRDRDDQRAPEDSGRHPQEQAASELSERSAESVGRRYDATKESVHEGHQESGDEDEDSRD